VPLVASRTSPTEMAIGLAEQPAIAVAGDPRPGSLDLHIGAAIDAEASR
jgi:hypothetical protein